MSTVFFGEKHIKIHQSFLALGLYMQVIFLKTFFNRKNIRRFNLKPIWYNLVFILRKRLLVII